MNLFGEGVELKKLSDNWPAYGCVVFTLPFVGAGLFMGYVLAVAIWDHTAMKSWVEVPAEIVRATLVDAEWSNSENTYRADATYRYRYDGVAYTGSRVSLWRYLDNLGPFQRDAFEELSRHASTGKAFRVFVNPDRPSESIVYRDLRGKMVLFHAVFAILFAGSGVVVIRWALAPAPEDEAPRVS